MEHHSSQKRYIYLDNLRLFLAIIIIIVHISMLYGGLGSFFTKETPTDNLSPLIFTILIIVFLSFSLQLFFFISGYFAAESYNEKGPKYFIKERLTRLGIPILIFATTFNFLIYYLIQNFVNDNKMTLISTYSKLFNNFYIIKCKHLWFLIVLLAFSMIYFLYRVFKIRINFSYDKFPSNKAILISILLLGLLQFLIRFLIKTNTLASTFFCSQFINFVFCFSIGTLAYKGNWFNKLSKNQITFWKKIALITTLIFIIMIIYYEYNFKDYLISFSFMSLLFFIIESLFCYSVMISIIDISKKNFNKKGKLIKKITLNFYTIYIIHPLIIIPLFILMLHINLPTYLKFILVTIIGVPLCFITSYLIRKIPFTKKVLG